MFRRLILLFYRMRGIPLFECHRCKDTFLKQQMEKQQWFCQACAMPIEVDCPDCGETYKVFTYSRVHAQVRENLKKRHPKYQFIPKHYRLCQRCDDIPF